MPDYDLGTARGRIELDASSLGRASVAFTSLGRVMLGFGVGSVVAFGYIVKAAADFEKIMSAVQAVSLATGDEMDQLRQKALDLGSATAFGAKEVGQAMEQLAKAGLTVPDILNGATEATINLAAAAGDELAGGLDSAASIIANAMKTFGAGAEDLDHFADVIVGAAASSTINVDDLATTLKYAGPIASTLGLTIDDLSTAIAILGDRGIRGSTAGTSLRGVLLALTPISGRAQQAMKDLGLITEDGTNRFYDMDGSLKPLPEVMQLLSEATEGLSEQEKVAAFNAIFMRRAMNSALILADQGAAGFHEYADAIAGLDASDIAATKLDNLAGDMTLLRNAAETLIIRVGLPLQEMLRGWVQSITDLVRWLNTVNPELLAQITLYAGIAGAILTVLGGLSLFLGMLFRIYRVFRDLRVAAGLLFGAVRLILATFLTNPIVLFMAALATLGFALYKAYQQSEEFRERVDGALQALKPVFEDVVGFVSNFVDQFGNLLDVLSGGDDIGQGVGEVVDNMFGNTGRLVTPVRTIVDALLQIDDAARTAFAFFADEILPVLWDFGVVVAQVGQDVYHWFIETGLPAIQTFARVVGTVVGTVVSWLLDTGLPAIQTFGSETVRILSDAVQWVIDNFGPPFSAAIEFITTAIDKVIGVLRFLQPYFEFVFQGIVDVVTTVARILGSVFEAVGPIIADVFGAIVDIVSRAWDLIRGLIEGALQTITGLFQIFSGILTADWAKVWEGIKNIFGGIWTSIHTLLTEGWGLIVATFENFGSILGTVISSGIGLLTDIVRIGWQFIVDLVSNIASTIVGLLSNAWDLLVSTTADAWNSVWTDISGFISNISTDVVQWIANIVTWFSEIPDKILGALGPLGQRLFDFVSAAVRRAYSAVVLTGALIIDWFRDLPRRIIEAIGSLGKRLYEAARKAVKQFVDGIKSMAGAVVDAGKGILGGIGDLIPGSPVKKGPLKVLNRGYAGSQVVQMLIEGMEAQLPQLNRVASIMAADAGIATGMSPHLAPAAPSTAGTSIDYNKLAMAVSTAIPRQLAGDINVYNPSATTAESSIRRELRSLTLLSA